MEDVYCSFTALKILYAKYVSAIIEKAMTAQYKEEAFSKFVEEADKQVEGKEYPSIAKKLNCFADMDWQACNNTFQYLGNVRKVVFEYYGTDAQYHKIAVQLCNKMIPLRNITSHEAGCTKIEDLLKAQQDALLYMDQFLYLAFINVVDENGKSYHESFREKYMAFQEQSKQSWYFLSDFLEAEKYDFSQFANVCITAGIECRCDNARYLFRSSDLERDLLVLKNHLSFHSELGVSSSQKKAAKKTDSKNKGKAIGCVIAFIVGIVIAAVLFLVLSGTAAAVLGGISILNKSKDSNQPQDNPGSFAGDILTDADQTVGETLGEDKPIPVGDNEIPEAYENRITALKYSDPMQIRLQTITVSVGGYATPSCANTWQNGTIYSENTAIAVGEGMLVKGVAAGETYIIYESPIGAVMAYLVIVE